MSKTLLKIIGLYQMYISPDHSGLSKYYPGGYCKFHPSCSEYTRQSIIKYGALKGSIRGIYRILRCNPLNKGGKDLP
ncbi:MAG: membrane protein insertion efficiency factor YidD [Candidatus Gracilibacteria bacterium]|nr:membrane protein insertion efficiency factor YidD [Candidatus Gracilibacteria bacterium]